MRIKLAPRNVIIAAGARSSFKEIYMAVRDKSFLTLFFILMIFSIHSIYAQWYYTLHVEQEFNSNPFGVPEAQEDQLSRLSMGFQKDWSKASAQYFGSYLSFLNTSVRNYYWHQIYINGGGDQTGWNLSAENRINREEYNIYDYLTIRSGFIHTENSHGILWRLNGLVAVNNFFQIPELNNLRVTASGSLSRSFQTKTSMIAALSFNYKYYLKEYIPVTLPEDSLEQMLSPVNGVNQGPGPGHGSGGGGKDGYYYNTSSSDIPQAAQFFLSLRLAQSLTKSTGLAIQYQGRLNLNDYDRSIAGLIPGYTTESQIFDDPMSYESQSIGVEIIQILPYQFSLKMAAYYQERQYVAQGVFLDQENFTESVLREDEFQTAWATIEKRFNFNLLTETSLALQLNYQWVDNKSNSYWYQYSSRYFSLSLQYDI
jgi:hypothetical protein